MSVRRVVVTGLGVVSPVGNQVETAWQNMLAGRSGIGPITEFDASNFGTKIAGEIRDLDLEKYIARKDSRRMDKFLHYGIAAGIDAVEHSGVTQSDFDPDRVGTAFGAGIGGIDTITSTHEKYLSGGPRKISPFFVPGTIINMIAGHLSIKYNLRGPNVAVVTACTTGAHNIGLAARMIAYGDADVMVAGGAEYATSPTAMGGFVSAKAMTTRNEEPEAASRPWDTQRDGFVLSNGAASLVLESEEHARARGAEIFAELIGFGMSADAHHITAPHPEGLGAASCMKTALRDASINPDQVDYVNAHGTSTPLGDRAECDAAKQTFGEHAYKLAVSSTKSMTGHMLGAAGAIEALVSVLAIRDQVLPPTINLDEAGEGCDLDFVPGQARETAVNVALSNSFGFGGTNGTLIFSKYQ